jgi:hypothetical protein
MEKIAYPFHSLIGLLKVVMQTIWPLSLPNYLCNKEAN